MSKKKKTKSKPVGSLRDRLIKSSKLDVSTLAESKYFGEKDEVPTPVLLVNAALSSRINGGLSSGIVTLAGESKTFKTMFGLLMVSSYLKKHKDAICLFYDSEFGSPPEYVKNFGIDMERVVHAPIKNIEELKFDCVQQLDNLERGDRVIIFIDSIGNLASKKEIDDALNENSAADMTRAKQLKSFFRMVTPYLTMLDIPLVNINHTYNSIGMFPTAVVSGGTGVMYSSNTTFIVKKKQAKDGGEQTGNHFDLYIEKSRTCREKSRVPIVVKYGKPLSPYAGLFELAKEMGYLESRKKGFYNCISDPTDAPGKRQGDIEFNGEFWKNVFDTTDLADAIHELLRLPDLNMGEEDEDES